MQDCVSYLQQLLAAQADVPGVYSWYDLWDPQPEAEAIANLQKMQDNRPKYPPVKKAA